jgi:hypothetical protein
LEELRVDLGFIGKYVQASAVDVSFVQSFDKRFFIDNSASVILFL